jgi:hypothetical protein
MNLTTVLKEIEAIKTDFIENKLTMQEVIECFYQIENHSKYCFTQIYNAFYSSTPAIYFE